MQIIRMEVTNIAISSRIFHLCFIFIRISRLPKRRTAIYFIHLKTQPTLTAQCVSIRKTIWSILCRKTNSLFIVRIIHITYIRPVGKTQNPSILNLPVQIMTTELWRITVPTRKSTTTLSTVFVTKLVYFFFLLRFILNVTSFSVVHINRYGR